ncbi:Glutamine-dependent NAD(+) synthetase, partial [Coelomomyces lativittatus]
MAIISEFWNLFVKLKKMGLDFVLVLNLKLQDTYISAWRVVLKLLLDPITENMLCDFGMPVRYQSQNYNCRVIVLNKKILLIRPKKKLANSGHYTEQRWFTAWPDAHHTSITLPSMIQTSTGQTTTMFGDAVIECLDTSIGFDICEEMWQSCNTYSTEIIVNGSASYFETDKFSARCTLARAASLKNSGIYMYTNLVGGENRVYYDGGPMIFQNGELVAHGERFTLLDVDVLVAHLSLSKLKMKKRPHSTSLLRVPVDFRLSCNAPKGCTSPILLEQLTYFHECKELEWMMVITGWLWDYLVKTHSTGFLLPLSGGLDSCSVAILVHYLCRRLEQDQFIPEINEKLQRMYPHLHSYTTQSLCKEMLHTVYLATQYSSEETKSRASKLADHLFTSHRFIDIEQIIQEWSFIVDKSLGHEPSGLALENVQARSRMVASYLFAQMLSQEKSEKRNLL